MKIKYLGTAAAEAFPAIFCNCKYCEEARELGDKNIRTRSQSLINDDLLIDFPPDTYHHFITHGIRGDQIKYLLITHAHSDHLYQRDLFRRYGCYAHNMSEPTLELYCSANTASTLGDVPNVHINVIKAFDVVEFGGYKITALPARHMPGGEPLNYDAADDHIRTSGAQIIGSKGATFYAVAISACHICKCIFGGVDCALTVSSMMHGEYGIDDVCLSVINIVGPEGIKGKLESDINDRERQKLLKSAASLKDVIKNIVI